jgi:integrase
MQAARKGEAFDIETGLPISELKKQNSVPFIEFARSYMDLKWPGAAAMTRRSLVEAVATVGATFVKGASDRPRLKDLRRILNAYALPPSARGMSLSDVDKRIMEWLHRNSRPVADLSDTASVREVLDGIATNLDGSPSAATVYRRKRAVLFNLLSYAVEQGLLDDNPLTKIKRPTPKMVEEVDPRIVANPRQVEELLTSVTYIGQRDRDRGAHLYAFFGTMYYSAARPAEVLALREQDCKLPRAGWGELALGESRPAAGKRWTDSGEVHDRRGLKHRAASDIRFVPIPPVLVKILLDHIDQYGVGPEGRLFHSPKGDGVVSSSVYYRVWRQARPYALTPSQVASPLVGRPYDLRHAAVSLWLNGGVPATEVAERAGHSVDVLLRVYAKCIYGERESVNRKIDLLYGDGS